MGNYCSSGQSKKDGDNNSDKSEESPSYQLATKKKPKDSTSSKEAPLADPEPTSDISGQVHAQTINFTAEPNDGNAGASGNSAKPQLKQLQGVASNVSDSASNSPLAVSPPCDLPSGSPHQYELKLHPNLVPLYGKLSTNRRIESDKKIVIYVLATNEGHNVEKSVLHESYEALRKRCQARGFELQLSNLHDENDANVLTDFLDTKTWVNGPLEAQGGHQEAANCLAELTRHFTNSYVVPVLFLGSNLGCPLLPLTIESQDFKTALKAAEQTPGLKLLEEWYTLDEKAQPECYRFNTNNMNTDDSKDQLNELLTTFVEIFSKELRDSYLTTVVEQEINNTVLISQELSKRCVWIQTGYLPPKIEPNSTPLQLEMIRRLTNIHNDLKNHLLDKNLIRIPPTIQFQPEQLANVLDGLLTSIMDNIVDEHKTKYHIPFCTMGVDRRLLSEIEAVGQHTKALGQHCANTTVLEAIKNYIGTDESMAPLVVYGQSGCGKSVVCAKVAENVHNWYPDCSFILRYSHLTPQSSDLTALIGSITEQLYMLLKNEPCSLSHDFESYTDAIKMLVESATSRVVIVIDSMEEVSDDELKWLPDTLSANVKIVITVTAKANEAAQLDAEERPILKTLLERVPAGNFVHIAPLSAQKWNDVLSFGGGDFYAANGSLLIPEPWKESTEKTPFQAKILWWTAWTGDATDQCDITKFGDIIFDVLEKRFDGDVAKFLIALLLASRDGLLETEIIDIIRKSNITAKPPIQLWSNFSWIMGPMLLHTNHIKFMDKPLIDIASQRYPTEVKNAHKVLQSYFTEQPSQFVDRQGKHKSYNSRKLSELPYHAFKTDPQSFKVSIYLTNLPWISDKLIATGCVHILSDIDLADKGNQRTHLVVLQEFLQTNIRSLNYDAQQFYVMFQKYLELRIQGDSNLNADSIVMQWLKYLKELRSTSLVVVNDIKQEDMVEDNIAFDLIVNLGEQGRFVATLNTEKEEVCVWDVPSCKKVRNITGVPQPTAICPVGKYGAAVLCRREIKVLDLDAGEFKVTLKGVMNQKMPYFGLHDAAHLVCLSRNRMYVNLMNLESGDCVTTFKAGEDRFLNSLLVSGDGRILVCGDETQKPFPLLVWHLSQRKLLYDLRIPHHDFVTSLSAITHEASYVCVVAKELNEPTPNFIVVYDLQSGTLFKKWKPTCNTVALAISQTNACVIAGLEDARILVWDLVTGNCKYTLVGHNAPVTLLKLDPRGRVLISGDKEGRDMSIRMWDLDTGNTLAVYTPPDKITTCEILPDGRYVAIALRKYPNLVTLKLQTSDANAVQESEADMVYGQPENSGKSFQF